MENVKEVMTARLETLNREFAEQLMLARKGCQYWHKELQTRREVVSDLMIEIMEAMKAEEEAVSQLALAQHHLREVYEAQHTYKELLLQFEELD